MIHIVFNEVDVKILQEAIDQDASLAGDVIQIKDDYAVGPINGLYEEEGREARKNWWRKVLLNGDLSTAVDDNIVDDYATIESITNTLIQDPDEKLWIWAAQNKHDVSGYYWLLPFLKEFQGRVYILYLNNLPFLNESGGLFYPSWLSEIPVKEFIKAKKLARLITPSEFEIDPDEWQRLATEEKEVRLLEGGKKLIQHSESFYDTELKKFITPNFQKVNKIINQFLTKAKNTTGDMFILWRIKELIANGTLEAQGSIEKMKDFEVKMADAAPSEEA